MSGTKCGVLLEIGGKIGLVGQWYVVAATLLDEGTLLCKKQFGLDLIFLFFSLFFVFGFVFLFCFFFSFFCFKNLWLKNYTH